MNFRPLHDRIVIRRITAEERTAGGVIIPDTAQEKPMPGEVIAVGPGACHEQGQIVALELKGRRQNPVRQVVRHRGEALGIS